MYAAEVTIRQHWVCFRSIFIPWCFRIDLSATSATHAPLRDVGDVARLVGRGFDRRRVAQPPSGVVHRKRHRAHRLLVADDQPHRVTLARDEFLETQAVCQRWTKNQAVAGLACGLTKLRGTSP